MGFVALIFAFLIEQARPLGRGNAVHRLIGDAADLLRGVTDAGERRHGVLGWIVLVAGLLLLLAVLEWLLDALHPLAVFGFHVLVLYLTLGFRQFSHAFTSVQLALVAGDVDEARRVLQRWLQPEKPDFYADELSVSDICRLAISHALVASHRHVFGPMFWYVLLPGASGPVLYRMAQMLARRWAPDDQYGRFAERAYRWIDWLPTRLSAAGFAVVGSFEDAIYAWRGALAAGTGDDQRALLLAAGGGALGMRLADPGLQAQWNQGAGQEFDSAGAEPGIDGLQSAVGLVWRSVVLWIALYAMLTVASWLGR